MSWDYVIYSRKTSSELAKLIDEWTDYIAESYEACPNLAERDDLECGQPDIGTRLTFKPDGRGLRDEEEGEYLIDKACRPEGDGLSPLDDSDQAALALCTSYLYLEDVPHTHTENPAQVSQVLFFLERAGEGSFFDYGDFQIERADDTLSKYQKMKSLDHIIAEYEDGEADETASEPKVTLPKRILTICENARGDAEHSVSLKRAIGTFDLESQNYLRLLFINGPLPEGALAEKLQIPVEQTEKIGKQILDTFTKALF